MRLGNEFAIFRTITNHLRKVDCLDVLGREMHTLIDKCTTVTTWALLLPKPNNVGKCIVTYIVIDGVAQRTMRNTIDCFRPELIQDRSNNTEPLYIEDIHRDNKRQKIYSSMFDPAERKGAAMFIPLWAMYSGELIGEIVIMNWAAHIIKRNYERQVLATIGALTSMVIENNEIIVGLKRVVLTDHLTGLYNRRALSSISDRAIEESIRYKQRMSVAIIDIDKFKTINDTYGHLKGDEVLVNLAEILNGSVRKIDYVMRFAGDEFIVLMPNTDKKEMEEVIKRIKSNYAKNKIQLPLKYSISIGAYSGEPRDLNNMISIADKKMYEEKVRHSSNRQVSANSKLRSIIAARIGKE